PLLEIEQRVGDESSSAHAMARADGAVLDYGPVFHVKHAVFDIQHGWRDIDKKTYKELVVYPIVEDSKELLFDWEYRLLGDYRLVPRPIVQRDNCGVSLREPREGKLRRLPTEFYELLNICSCGELALSFDRFRIAVVGQIVRRKPDSPYELGWLVYLLRVIYEGSVEAPVVLRSSPNASSSEAGRLGAKARLRVVEAMNYEKEPSGRQDFWYRVEDGKLSGWVFGGELLIEGQGWKERLKLRGEPLDLEALLKDR
ncbi:MAG: SH3 domain-containing protein, partial [candidate division WOR-3 bacterium]